MSTEINSALPLHLILPLLAGMVYVLGALALKRASDLGADIWRTVRLCNFVTSALFMPLLFLGGKVPSWDLWWQPASVALLYVLGQVFALLALNVGDVSVATPVLGVKIPLVALLTTVLSGEQIGLPLWTAAFLATAAIALLNVNRSGSHHHLAITILFASLAAGTYALFDVLVQKWSPAWGAGRFLPIMMAFVGFSSIGLRPLSSPQKTSAQPLSATAWRWLFCGAIGLGLQGLMFVTPIALYGQATAANVLYSSRGFWSVLAVDIIGHWFKNREQHHGWSVLAWRMFGAILMMAAIVIAMVG